MLACNVIPRLAALFNDKEASVRRNAHKAVSMYSEAPPGRYMRVIMSRQTNVSIVLGAQNLIDLRLVDTLLKKLVTELDEIKVDRLWIEKSVASSTLLIFFTGTDFEHSPFLPDVRCRTSSGLRRDDHLYIPASASFG
jgi:hypothetical protein